MSIKFKSECNTCHPFNTSNKDYYFDYEEDEDHIYFWLNVSFNFSRGDIFMDEKSNTPVEAPTTTDNEHIGTAQSSNIQESSLDTCDTSLIPSSTTAVTTETASTTIVYDNDIEPPTIESLTLEIRFHLNQMGFHVIEVGKRLIQAKELVPHGQWADWLKHNFNLTIRSVQRFIAVADRFSNATLMSHFDVSTFKPTQLIALLALPEGEEDKFIEQKAAEGNPADQMTIKQLRAEIQKYNADLQKAEYDHNLALVKIAELQDTVHEQAEQIYNLERNYPVPNDYEALEKELAELRDRPVEFALPDDYESIKHELATLKDREDSFKRDFAVSHALNQMFAIIPTLLNADNLQNVVSDAADNDLQSFELHLAQLAKLHSQLQKYLAAWQDDLIYKRPIDRVAIISELKQIMLQDSSTRTSSKIEDLISSLGYKKLLDIPDDLLPDLLKKVRKF